MEEFSSECSDDEIKEEFSKTFTGWEPSTSEVARLYEALDQEGTLPITWYWALGKRPPTPTQEESDSEKEEETKVEISGFDFDDEPATVRLTPRRQPGSATPRGSAKKKTSNFNDILATVRRQKKVEAKEKRKRERR